jgi:hypothetical protein
MSDDKHSFRDSLLIHLRDSRTNAYTLDNIKGLGELADSWLYRNVLSFDDLVSAWLRIRTKSGKLERFTLSPAQQQLSNNWGARNIVLKARQLGITTYVAARFFIHTITHAGTLSVQVAHDQDAAEEIFQIVHRFVENLPPGVRRELRTSRSNVRQIVFPGLDSEYRVETAADPNAGRGLTIQNLHCSEVARWTGDPADTLASLRAAVPPAGSTIVLESTPNGAAGAFYSEWNTAAETGYVQHFFPWWIDPNYLGRGRPPEKFTDEEKALIDAHGLSRQQIAFRRHIRSNFRGLAVQEFAEDPVSCFRASGECVFDLDAIEARLKELVAPAATRDSGRVQIFFPPQATAEYVIGVDPAGGGVEGDYACAQIVERASGMQCAELHAHLTPQELASQVAALAREYNQALVAVERNNHGHAVLAYLDTSEHYDNIFFQSQAGRNISQGSVSGSVRGSVRGCPTLVAHGQGGIPPGASPGWLTTAASRPRIIEQLAAFLANDAHLLHSRGLLEECRTFVRDETGFAAAASGSHDDRVLAMAIALEVRSLTAGRAKRRVPQAKASAAHA